MKFWFIVFTAIYLIGGLGWGLNLYKFFSSDFEKPYREEILRGAGLVLAPFGAVLGYMELNSGEDF